MDHENQQNLRALKAESETDPAYAKLSRVTSMPQDTPPEIKDLLGCE